eukprot:CAMPEP_0194201332 /NCGR_PEP_ID=MMETSP0156-20130528/1622_1 /TAXON_ID=33649 /ORGANISM="Thalassionema nitzschioides, Strain L26-B" /LENGTH=185 /DNA_ID=CAMNT_0038926499 /DNA_START=86 /DNA_END=640 /DNA_ORIENTATION=-
MNPSIELLSLLLFIIIGSNSAFIPPPCHCSERCLNTLKANTATKDDQKLYWLEEFKAPSGEILNPYNVLKISRDANITEVKQAYRELSRKYHPDTLRFRDVLPGSCNNLDDARDEWERIKLSHEILRNPRIRKRYDRQEFLADPGAAAKRVVAEAALDVVGKSISGLSSGMFAAGSFVWDKMTEK